jgi:hypothetical protein
MEYGFGLGRPQWRWVWAAALGAVPLAGCGGAQTPAAASAREPVRVASSERATRLTDAQPGPDAAPEPAPAQVNPAKPELVRALPSGCEPGVEPCSAPAKFVEKVCHAKYPDLALVMFSKGTPWRRGYLKVEKLEPVNIYEGERSDDWLAFGEEVVILRTRGPSAHGGVQVSGPTDVDVLRWDGTCATIRQEMLAQWPTNTSILTARVVWKYLSEPVQQALLGDKWVAQRSDPERSACRARR